MVSVEPGTPADADAVTALWIDLARDQRRHGSHLCAEANRSTVRAVVAADAAAGGLVVARADGDVVGFVRYGVEHGSFVDSVMRGVVRDLYVGPDWRDEGVGSRLLDAAEAELRDRGVDAFAVEALAANEDAIRFYERRGYTAHRVEFEREVESDKRPGGNR